MEGVQDNAGAYLLGHEQDKMMAEGNKRNNHIKSWLMEVIGELLDSTSTPKMLIGNKHSL